MISRLLRCAPELLWLLLLTAIFLLLSQSLPPLSAFALASAGLSIFLLPGMAIVSLLGADGAWWERVALGFVASLAVPGLMAQCTIFLHTNIQFYFVGFTILTALLLVAVMIRTWFWPAQPHTQEPVDLPPLWLRSIFGVMLALLVLLHLHAPLDGDHWDATAYIQNIRHDQHILTGDPKFNAGLGLSPRFDFSAWLVDQALISYITGLDPVDQFQAIRLPLLLIAIAAFYRMTRSLNNRQDAAMVTVVIWIGYLLVSNYGTVAGYELLVRPDLDKVVAGFIVLPITLAAVMRLFHSQRRQDWVWLAVCSVAAGLTHPIAAVLVGLSLAWFGVAELVTNLNWITFKRLTFIALILMIALTSPVYSVYRASTLDVEDEAVMAATSLTDTRDPSMSRRLRGTLDLQRLWILDNGQYILHPRLILQPIHLPVLLGLPLLFMRQRRSRPARLLFGMVFFISLLLSFPPTASILGRFTTPWLFYRLHWPISMAAVVVLGWATWAVLWRIPQPRLRAASSLAIWVLLLLLAFPFMRASFSLLSERKQSRQDSFCTWADEILRPFQELARTDTMVLGDPAINICLIGYAPYAGVMEWRTVNVVRNYIGAGREAEGWERLWDAQYYASSEFLDKRILAILTRWQIGYAVIKLDSPLEPQLRLMPELFEEVTTAAGYRIFQVLPLATEWQNNTCSISNTSCLLIEANSLLTAHQWQEAIGIYERLEDAADPNIRHLAHLGMGRAYQHLGNLDAALSAWQRAHEAKPDEAQPLALRGAIFTLQEAWDPARASYQQALQRTPDQSLLHTRLGDIHVAMGEMKEAEAAYQRAALLVGERGSYDYYLSLGQQWLAVGAYERAALNFHQAYDLYGDREAANLLGQVYRQAQRWDEATALYRRLTLIDPWGESGHLGLGQVYRAQGDPARAIAKYRLALRLHPLAANGYQELGNILREQYGLPAAIAQIQEMVGYRLGFGDALLATTGLQAMTGAIRTALGEIGRAMVWDRMDAKYYIAAASYQLGSGHAAQAEVDYRKVLEFSQNNVDALLGLGQVATSSGTPAAVEGYALRATQVSPSNPAAILALANHYENRADPQRALAHYQKAVANCGGSSYCWIALGDFHFRQGNLDAAMNSHEAALRIQADATTAYRSLSTIYQSQGQGERAAEMLKQAIEVHPGEEASYLLLAQMQQQQEDREAARQALQQALQLNPGYAAAYTALGNLYQQTNLPNAEEEIYRQLIEQAPNLPQGYVALGLSFERQGDLTSAAQTYQEGLAMVGPRLSGSLHLSLANLQQRRGQSTQAHYSYQQALTQQPALEDGYLALSRDYLQRGEWERSAAMLEQGLDIAPTSVRLRVALVANRAGTDDAQQITTSYRELVQQSPGSIEARIVLANHYVASGDPQKALAEIEKAQQTWTGSLELLAQRITLELLLGNLHNALEIAQQGIANSPGDTDAWLSLGMVQSALAQFDQAEEAYREAVQRAPGSAAAWMVLGDFLHQRGEYATAIDAINRAISLDQSTPAPYLLLAQVQQQMGLREAALQSLQTAAQLDATSAAALRGIGQIYDAIGESDRAEAYLHRALSIAPIDVETYQALSQFYTREQQFEQAHQILLQATTVQPVSCESYQYLGDFLMTRGDWNGAESAYQQAQSIPGCTASAARALGNLYRSQGNYNAAMESFHDVVSAAPGDAVSYIERGKLYESQHRNEEALGQYRAAVETAPSSALAYVAIGEWYQAQAQWEDAEQAFQQAIHRAPTDSTAYVKLGTLCQQRGRWQDALALYQQGISASPTSVDAYVALGKWYQAQAQWEDAEKAYEEAISIAPANPIGHIHLDQLRYLRPSSRTQTPEETAERDRL